MKQTFSRLLNRALSNPYVLIAPAFLICITFSTLPILLVVCESFMRVDYVSGTMQFIGLDNYIRILSDPGFLLVLRNTCVFTFFTVVVGVALALPVAVFLNKNTPVHNLVQTVVFTPHIISFVSISILWMFLMDPQFGLLNYVLRFFGLPPLRWMLVSETSLLSIIIVAVWKDLGYNVLILIAGMQNVPQEVYEAARLDKSSPVKMFFHITLPMISPTLAFLVTTSLISSFSAFDIVNLMTKGGPKNSSNLLVHWIYQTGFQHYQVGSAMAGGIILLVLVGVVSVLSFSLMNKKVYYK